MKQTEEEEQAALFQYAEWQKHPWNLLFAIPNGGKRSPKTGAMLKRTGTKAGIPDIFLPVARSPHYGLFIELKSLKGRIQPHQQVWHENLRKEGYAVEVCRGCEDAVKAIKEYLGLK